MEKIFEDKNGYVYPSGKTFGVHWKNAYVKPNKDRQFTTFNQAYFYLRSVRD